MHHTPKFCEERADEAAKLAREADLPNVRNRARRSEETWRKMADRLRNAQRLRTTDAEPEVEPLT